MAYRFRGRRRTGYRRRATRKYRSRFTRKLARSLTQKDTCRLIITQKPTTQSLKFVSLASTGNVGLGYCTKAILINPMYLLTGYEYPSGGSTVKVDGLPGFGKFRELFDQFKVNAIRVKVQIVAQPIGATSSAIVVRSAIDRNGIASEFNNLINAQDDTSGATINAVNEVLETYSSFNTKIINVTDLYSLYRTFYPVGKERGTWYGSSFKFTPASENTTSLSEFMYPFKPLIMLQFAANNVDQQSAGMETFNISIDYDITFKGQRNITSAAPSS